MLDVVGQARPSASATAFLAQDSLAWSWENLRQLLSLRHPLLDKILHVPGSGVIWRYIKSSHRNDPVRTLLEFLLFLFVVYTWLKGRTRGDKGGNNFVKLTEREINELVADWNPEPLLWHDAEAANLPEPLVTIGPPSLKSKVAQDLDNSAGNSSKQILNLASSNFSGLAQNEIVKEKAIECLRSYGVGSCGPSGFYGFFDVHIELELALGKFLDVESCIIYPQGFTTVCSVIPSFSKRGDIIVADKGVNFAIQKGIQISRSHVRWFEHNDMDSLEAVLASVDKEFKRVKGPLTRRFIVTEGLSEGDGQIADLPRLIELKKKYKYRLMLDESWSFGALGNTGKGVSEFYNLPAREIDIIMGSMATSLCAGGGFCAGSSAAISHQRINSAAYVFSASLPPLLAVAAHEGLNFLSGKLSTSGQLPLSTMAENLKTLRMTLDKLENIIYIPSSPESPLIHIMVRRNENMTFHEEQKLLQEIVDECRDNGVLINRTKKVWKQESVQGQPSLRIHVSAGHTKKEMEKAASVIKSALTAKLGKPSKR